MFIINRNTIVKRGSTTLTTNSQYTSGESLSVTISDTTPSDGIVLENTGATFTSGTCSGKRYVGTSATIVMPTSGTVTIWSAWATCNCQVKITPIITLTPSTTPTPQPTSIPTRIPSANPTFPTISPTFLPTIIPTFIPTSLPSLIPSIQPSTPTITPTLKPTQIPSFIPTYLPSLSPTISFQPTISLKPTYLPSLTPTNFPSTFPTLSPSLSPTLLPSISSTPSLTSLPSIQLILSIGIWIESVTAGEIQLYQKQICNIIKNQTFTQVSYCQIIQITDAGNRRLSLQYSSFTNIQSLLNGCRFIVLLSPIQSNSLGTIMITKLIEFIEDQSNKGFIQLILSSITQLTPTNSGVISFDILEDSISSFTYSCKLSNKMSISWSIDSLNNNNPQYILGQLSMKGLLTWFSAGVVSDNTKLMVTTPPASVYLVKPQDINISNVGTYAITSYLSGGIIPDIRYRNGSGITKYLTSNTFSTSNNEQILQFKLLINSTLSSDPVLDLSLNGYNVLLWGHGGDWPKKHSLSSRGVINIYWKQGYCKINTNDSYFIFIFFGCITFLLIGGILFNYLIRKMNLKLTYQYLFLRRLDEYLINLPIISRDISSMSLIGFLFFIIYIIITIVLIIFSGKYYIKNSGYTFNRSFGLSFGQFTLFCFGLVTLPASKTSMWNKLLKIPYDRIIKYHRLFSYFTLILLILHVVYEIKTWTTKQIFTFNLSNKIGNATILYGILSGICFIILNILSISLIRNFCYELFLFGHIFSLPGLIFICFHIPQGIYYLLPSFLLYGIDYILRLNLKLKNNTKIISSDINLLNNFTKLTFQVESSSSSLSSSLSLSNINIKSPGSYVLLNISNKKSLFFSKNLWEWEWHPFSIFNENSNKSEFSICMKSQPKGWTEKISNYINEKKDIQQINVKILGPFGYFPIDLSNEISNFTHVLFISGGIGITPILSIGQKLFEISNLSNELIIDFILVSKTLSLFSMFSTELSNFERYGKVIKYITQENQEKNNEQNIQSKQQQQQQQQVPIKQKKKNQVSPQISNKQSLQDIQISNISHESEPIVNYSKPNFSSILTQYCNSVSDHAHFLIISCGPHPLQEALKKSIRDCRINFSQCKFTCHYDEFNL